MKIEGKVEGALGMYDAKYVEETDSWEVSRPEGSTTVLMSQYVTFDWRRTINDASSAMPESYRARAELILDEITLYDEEDEPPAQPNEDN